WRDWRRPDPHERGGAGDRHRWRRRLGRDCNSPPPCLSGHGLDRPAGAGQSFERPGRPPTSSNAKSPQNRWETRAGRAIGSTTLPPAPSLTRYGAAVAALWLEG